MGNDFFLSQKPPKQIQTFFFFVALHNEMSRPTNDQFLRDKINGFVAFLTACLYSRLNNQRYKEFEDAISQLRVCDTGHFILHVTEQMCPYRSNVPAYVERMLGEHAVKPEDLTTDERAKLERYVSMFIEVVSQ